MIGHAEVAYQLTMSLLEERRRQAELFRLAQRARRRPAPVGSGDRSEHVRDLECVPCGA